MIDIDSETGRVTIFCDDCGEYHNTDLYDVDEAKAAALGAEWLFEVNKAGWEEHYCPDCKDNDHE